MTTRRVVFFEAQYAPSADTAMYTTPAGIVATIDKLTARNADSVARTVGVRLVPPSGTPTGTDFLVSRKTIQPGEECLFPAIVGHMLAEDGTINVEADAAGVVVIRSSGREDPAEG